MLDSTVVLESGGVGLICCATLRCRALILESTNDVYVPVLSSVLFTLLHMCMGVIVHR